VALKPIDGWSDVLYSALKGQNQYFVSSPTYRLVILHFIFFQKSQVIHLGKVFCWMIAYAGFGYISVTISDLLGFTKMRRYHLANRNFSSSTARFFIHLEESAFNFLSNKSALGHSFWIGGREYAHDQDWPPIWIWSTIMSFAKLHLGIYRVLPRVPCRIEGCLFFVL